MCIFPYSEQLAGIVRSPVNKEKSLQNQTAHNATNLAIELLVMQQHGVMIRVGAGNIASVIFSGA